MSAAATAVIVVLALLLAVVGLWLCRRACSERRRAQVSVLGQRARASPPATLTAAPGLIHTQFSAVKVLYEHPGGGRDGRVHLGLDGDGDGDALLSDEDL